MDYHDFNKVIRIGTVPANGRVDGRRASVYCKIEYKNERLSITGVIGPLASGNCLGSSGQINSEFRHRDKTMNRPCHPYQHLYGRGLINFAPGWNWRMWQNFLELWHKFHLNDMHAGCRHQRKLGWGGRRIDRLIVRVQLWKLIYAKHTEAARQIRMLMGQPSRALFGDGYPLTYMYLDACRDAEKGIVYEPKTPEEKTWWDSGVFSIEREVLIDGQTYPKEHPEGVLAKRCPVCGYRYGTKWLFEPVPVSALEYLESLPDADKECPWTSF